MAHVWLRNILAAVVALGVSGLTLPAAAIDLTGRAVAAKAIEDMAFAAKPHKPSAYIIMVYFGTKGNRFAVMGKGLRVVIPPGQNSGRARSGEFIYTVTLDLQATTLGIKIRTTASGGYDDLRTFDISLSEKGCTLTRYRHTPDARLNYISKKVKADSCSIGHGQPKLLGGE